jgi:hypothetical protein
MNKVILFLLLFYNAVVARAQTCDCQYAYDYTIKKIEANYSGFRDKVTNANRGLYQAFKDSLGKVAALPVNQQQDSCLKVLWNYIGFLKDGHVSVRLTTNVAVHPDSIRASFASWPSLPYTNTSFKEYLHQNKSKLKPLEGIWQNEEGNYRVGIIFRQGNYTAFILKADSIYWMPGQVKFEIALKQNDFTGTFYMRDHSAQPATYNLQNLAQGFIEIGERGKWYKLDDNEKFIYSAFYPGSSIASFRQLSNSTNILTIKSFDESNRRVIDSIITANDQLIRSTDNLIIDVRGNGGGSDFTYYPLRKYLFTHPYVRYGAEILATNDNIEKFRGITTNPNFTKQEQEMYKKRVAEMEKHLDQFWSSSPVSFMSDTMEVLSYPKKVAVLIDKGCGSTTEQFLLDPVGNSKKAIIYGQPSAGVLDYANLHFFTIPNTNFRVNYATSRSKRVDIGKGIDNKGIQPHVLLDATVKDWVQYVKQQLEK